MMADICSSGGKNMLTGKLHRQLTAAVSWPIPLADERPLSGVVVELQKNHRAKGLNIQTICREIKDLASDESGTAAITKKITELAAPDFNFQLLKRELLQDNLHQLLAQKYEIFGEEYSCYDLKKLGQDNKVKILLPLIDKLKILCEDK
ncbi:MAG: hypothetical protein RRY34_10670, partial [Victivallaceae bacterium]